MSLYLLPPTGTVAFHKLEEYATKRLQFLLRLVACNSKLEVESVLEDANVVDQSDCLITNTAKDEISHHILRLTLGGDPESMSFFCDSELALFKLRVENMVVDEWTVFFKTAEKFLRKLEGSLIGSRLGVLSDLKLVFEILQMKFESWYQLSTEICVQTACLPVSLPFQLALRLVAGRLVSVVKGMAAVPVVHLKDVFIELFEKLMVTAAHQASMEREWAMTDERILKLAGTLKGLLRAETRASQYQPGHCPALKLADLWEHSAMFPPCMEKVVRVLQDEHTLKHHDRIQLTLFLKELGLPVNDALLLWKREYSVPAKGNKSRSCQQRWQGNERRYIYNIRHLYGLEGSRTNYRAHSCSAIQNRALTCGDAGGCPFVSHDLTGLKASLLDKNLHKDNTDHILKLCHRKMYGNACQSFMQDKLKQVGKIQSDFISDDRHIRIEVENSHGKLRISDSSIKTCQEKFQLNGVTRKKLKCVARFRSCSRGKMLPDKLADDFGEKFQTTFGTSSSLKSFADRNPNLQNKNKFVRLPLPSSYNQNLPNPLVSSSNLIKEVISLNSEGSSVDDKRKHVYQRKRYLFKVTSKNQLEGLVQNGIYSNTGSGERNMTSKESSSRHLVNDKTNELVSQQQEMNSDTEALQDKFVLKSGKKGTLLQAHHSRFFHCSKQAEMTSLAKRKQDSFSSDVCEDGSVETSNGISVSVFVRGASGLSDPVNGKQLSDPGEWLSDPVNGKQLSDLSEGKWLSNLGEVKQLSDHGQWLSDPAKCIWLSDHGEVKKLADPSTWLSDPVDCKQFSDYGELKQLADPSQWLSDPSQGKWLSDPVNCKWLSDPSEGKWLSDPVNGKWLSDPSEGKRLSDPVKCKWLSGHGKVKQLADTSELLSDPVNGKQLSDLSEKQRLSDPVKCKWLSDPSEGKWLSILEGEWLSDPAKYKWLSDHEEKQVSDLAESKYLPDLPEGKRLSNSTECKWLSNSTEGKRLSNSIEGKQLSNSTEGKQLSNSTEGKRLSNSTEGTRLSNSTEGTRLSNSTEGTRLSNSTEGTRLSNSTEGTRLSNSTEGTRLSNSTEGTRLSNSTEGTRLSNSTEGTRLSDPGCVKQLTTTGKEEHLSCADTQHPKYQGCTAEYKHLSTLEGHPASDPLPEGKPSGSVEMKTDTQFLCEKQSHHSQLSHAVKETTEIHAEGLHPHSLAGSLHPHSLAEGLHPHSLAGSLHPHSLAEGLHPHSLAGSLHPHSLAESLHPHSLAGSLHLHSLAESLHPHSLAGSLHLHSLAESLHKHSLAEGLHPHSLAGSLHTHSLAESLHPLSLAESLHPHSLAESLHPHSLAESLHTHSLAESLHTHSLAESLHTHSLAESLHTHSLAESLHPHSLAGSLHPHSLAGSLHTHSLAESLHPHSLAESLHPHSLAESLHPHSLAESLHTHSLAESLHPHSLAESLHTHSLAESLHTHSLAESLHPHSLAGSLHPHSLAESLHTHSLAESLHPHSLAESLHPHSLAGSLHPRSLAEGTVSIKKPRDIYWFSRDLFLL